MAVNDEQQRFLEQLALRIPLLFETIRAGNAKCEYIIGVRRIGGRYVQLKLTAEVVDPGVNPLRTHGMPAPLTVSVTADALSDHGLEPEDSCADREEGEADSP